jgi:hypothetical protein
MDKRHLSVTLHNLLVAAEVASVKTLMLGETVEDLAAAEVARNLVDLETLVDLHRQRVTTVQAAEVALTVQAAEAAAIMLPVQMVIITMVELVELEQQHQFLEVLKRLPVVGVAARTETTLVDLGDLAAEVQEVIVLE